MLLRGAVDDPDWETLVDTEADITIEEVAGDCEVPLLPLWIEEVWEALVVPVDGPN